MVEVELPDEPSKVIDHWSATSAGQFEEQTFRKDFLCDTSQVERVADSSLHGVAEIRYKVLH